MTLAATAPALLGVAGLVTLPLGAILGPGRWRHGLGIALDLWLAAILVRLLLADPSWAHVAAAALVVALRPLLRTAVRAPVPPTSERPPPTPQPT